MLGSGVTLESTLGGHFGSRVTNFVRTTHGTVEVWRNPFQGSLPDSSYRGWPWASSGSHWLGWFCAKGRSAEAPAPRPSTVRPPWEILVLKALRFIGRRRRVSLTSRPTPTSTWGLHRDGGQTQPREFCGNELEPQTRGGSSTKAKRWSGPGMDPTEALLLKCCPTRPWPEVQAKTHRGSCWFSIGKRPSLADQGRIKPS